MFSRIRQRIISGWLNLPLRAKGFIVVAIPLAVMLLATVSFYLLDRQEGKAQAEVAYAVGARNALRNVVINLSHAQVETLNLALTGTDNLNDYNEARRHTMAALVRLEALKSKSNYYRAEQIEAIESAMQHARQALQHLSSTRAVKRNTTATTRSIIPASAQRLVLDTERNLDGIRREIQVLTGQEDQIIAARMAEVEQARRRQAAVIVAAVVLGPLSGLIAISLFTSGVAYRVRRLEANAGRLAQEMPLLPLASSGDEIGRLTQKLESAHDLLVERGSALRQDAERLASVVAAQQEVATAQLDLGAIMNLVAERARKLTRANGAVIELVEGEDLVYRAASGDAAAHLGLRLKMDTSLSGQCVRTGEVLRCDDAEADPRVDREACRRTGVRSMIVVPLRHDHEWIGVLKVLAAEVQAFGEQETHTLLLMAELIASAIYRQQIEQRLKEAKEEAERANLAKSEFLSRMSHELRTPLNAILGFGQLLEMDTLTPRQQQSVEHILKGGRHLLDLINEVLDIARIEAGRMTLSPEPVAMHDVLQETMALVRPLAAPRGIQVERLNGGAEPYHRHVRADRQRLKQVVLNLLGNAIKYNRDGGSVSVSCEEVHSPSKAIEASWLRIQVRDTGPGIPEAKMHRLFVPFDRLDAEQSRVEGTGLGLALSRRLIEAMGGTMGVSSTVGEGSAFWFELPVVESPVAQHERADGHALAAAETEQPARTVLYVEDNLSNLQLIERLLERRPGIELLSAMQGSVGLELAREHQPDLILLDVHLPDIPGHDVLLRLQAEPETRHIPVVVLSADATPGQIQRLLSAGARDYLTKPLNVKRFLEVLDENLQSLQPDTTARP